MNHERPLSKSIERKTKLWFRKILLMAIWLRYYRYENGKRKKKKQKKKMLIEFMTSNYYWMVWGGLNISSACITTNDYGYYHKRWKKKVEKKNEIHVACKFTAIPYSVCVCVCRPFSGNNTMLAFISST